MVFWEIQVVDCVIEYDKDLVDCIPWSVCGSLQLVGLLEKVDFVLELPQNVEVLGEQLSSGIEGRDDDLLVADSDLLLCEVVLSLMVQFVSSWAHAPNHLRCMLRLSNLVGDCELLGSAVFSTFAFFRGDIRLLRASEMIHINMLDVNYVHFDSCNVVFFFEVIRWKLNGV